MGKALLLFGAHTWEKDFAIQTALRMGVHLILACSPEDSSTQILRIADKVLLLDPYEPHQLLRRVLEYAGREPIDGVAGLSDFVLNSASGVARALGLRHLSHEAIQCANDKYLFRQRLAGRPDSVPLFTLIRDMQDVRRAAAEARFPAILKPRDLGASVGVHKVPCGEALEDVWRLALDEVQPFKLPFHNGDFLLESYIERKCRPDLPSGEFSVESVSFEGRHFPVAFTDKRILDPALPLETAQLVPAPFADQDPGLKRHLAEVVCSVLEMCGIEWGVTHTEIILHEKGETVTEIHLRPAGDRIIDLVFHALGINLYEILFRLALGKASTRPGCAPNAMAGR